jgi:hypothetical protein
MAESNLDPDLGRPEMKWKRRFIVSLVGNGPVDMAQRSPSAFFVARLAVKAFWEC